MKRIISHDLAFIPYCTAWTDTSLSGSQDSVTTIGCTNSIQSKRLQVINVWKEVQQLEEDVKKILSAVTTAATQRCMKGLKVLGNKLSDYPYIALFHTG